MRTVSRSRGIGEPELLEDPRLRDAQLAAELERWRLDARTVNLMVGGPEGLAPEVCARAEQRWSLSPLTLPHPLVRILIGEQIYRAWTVLSGHPYHK